jgi:Tfp pilus assembly protein PilV
MIGRNRNAFSLLEVVLALAVFAIIVVPAIGLVALSYRNSETDLQAPNAVEIKSLLELELRGVADPDGFDGYAFSSGFLSGGSTVVFYASQNLDIIDQGGVSVGVDDKYYKVMVTEPVGYVYSDTDAYRVFLFNVIWPAFVSGVNNENNAEGLQQLILPAVLSK